MAVPDDVADAFRQACKAFNDAYKSNDYSGMKPYLADNVYVLKVDDLDAIDDTSDNFIKYLNDNQRGKWPQLKYKEPDYDDTLTNTAIYHVSGEAMYQDVKDGAGVKVRYGFRLIQNSQSQWVVATAFTTPIS